MISQGGSLIGISSTFAEGLDQEWQPIVTPAFVYDEGALRRKLEGIGEQLSGGSCKLLFSIKSFSFVDALRLMTPYLDGFAVSSIFEAQLAREAAGTKGTVHITSPGIRPDEMETLASICDYVSFNSLSQLYRYRDTVKSGASCGLSVNPQVSFVEDERYDPCRIHSKLGVPLEVLVKLAANESDCLLGLKGLHLHSNCDSGDLGQLKSTVDHLERNLSGLLGQMEWINLGGGYLFDDSDSTRVLGDIAHYLKSQYDLTVFVEPGAALVRSAGYIVSTVLDIFQSDGKELAVLDTSVNHMPEVFEYGYEPDVLGHEDNAPFEYILAGCTCLSGDVFGNYQFNEPLEIGSKVVFFNAGAYTLTKAHMFNGVNLPTIYALTAEGGLVLKKKFTYAEFAARWGLDINAPD